MTTPLAANLAALASRNPDLARLLDGVAPSSKLTVDAARSGKLVPLVDTEGRRTALHSLVDPEREGERLFRALTEQAAGSETRGEAVPGYLFVEGLGGAYHLEPFLASAHVYHVLIVETDAHLLRALLESIDLHLLLSDSRVELMLDPASPAVAAHVRSTYLPAVMGRFVSVPLRSRVRLDPAFFESARDAARDGLEDTSKDYSVQATFGRVWTRNILLNLSRFASSGFRAPGRIGEAIVTAAGPSLDEQADELSRLREGRFLIATDTSLPVLLGRGLTPQAVLTIDCQNLGYQHYLRGLPAETRLFAELAAPPSVVRLSENVTPAAGGHPLSRLVATSTSSIPAIDTAGGNVAHAAVSLAFSLGASRVYLFGADFSYPSGRPYARGTYLSAYFAQRQTRTNPLEGGFADLIYRNSTLRGERVGNGLRYTTDTLLAYRERLEASFSAYGGMLVAVAGSGLPLNFSRPAPGGGGRTPPIAPPIPPVARGALREAILSFVEHYRGAVMDIDVDRPLLAQAGSGSRADTFSPASVLATLYPVMARIRRNAAQSTEVRSLIAEAKSVVMSIIDHTEF